ncbi:CYTH and CHAD domain-containing protein [Moraxella osloensis]|uniref:Inorganic triphosphatase n=1 Tax=Faucicola osloensis TaxID=34062 RepID=A0A2D2LWA7_FAUOS|nr:CYTH and CHAD domain-containing protein [Moraxella osloensis]ATR79276.1 inorganic triphosphatase [Moraxella osloensis]
MHELELKFAVPSYQQSVLRKNIDTKTAQQQRLSAYYFDTPNQDLAKKGIALRIRFEDSQWVQTLKTAGDGVAKRVELNTVLSLTGTPDTLDVSSLVPDISLITEQAVVAELTSIMPLDELAQALTVQYFTDVQRTSRQIKKNNSRIEIAYDIGKVGIGHLNSQKPANNPGLTQSDIHEIEFELLEGDPSDLIEVAKTWCKKYKLYLSTVTKAQRGSLLLANKQFAEPVKADLAVLQLHKGISQFAFLQAVVNNCLVQILPNASAIAEGSPDGNLVHQLRVGIRRLRTALKHFKFAQDYIDPNWLMVLKQTFSLLGEYRDKEILQIKTQPLLESVGAPHVEWSTAVDIMPIDAVRANDFQILLLELIGFTHLPVPADSPKAKATVAKKLQKLFTAIAAASDKFASLDTDSQHGVRKDLKSLRYVSEFAAPLFASQNNGKKGKKATKLNAFLQYLEPAQDILGEYNDNVVGHANYLEKAKTDPNALFAVGWFSGREQASAEQCAVSLKTVKNAPKFW